MKNKARRSDSRRDFIKKSAVAGAAMMAGCSPKVAEEVAERTTTAAPATGAVLGANDRITAGFIGVGGQGYNSHLRNIVNMSDDGSPRHEQQYNAVGVAAADVFDKRVERSVAELKRGDASDVQGYLDYREMLDRDDIDAIFIGTVDHWHSRIAIDAMDAGKDVYCEKPMTRYLPEAFELYDAWKRTGRKFQIGSQYCTEGKWHKAAELIQANRIGPLVLAQDSYHRNTPDGEWNYYEIEEESNPQHIDWAAWLGPVSDRPFDAEEYHRWRKYYPYCAGILGDLLAHRIHPLIIASGNPAFPIRVAGIGRKYVTNQMVGPEDRDVPDNIQVLAEFPDGLNMVVTGATVNEQGLGQVYRGHEATLYFSGNNLELRPERPFADLVDREMFENIEPGPSIPAHIGDFFDAMRNDTEPNGNMEVAIRAQAVISLAEMSNRLGEMLYFDEGTRKITTGSGREIDPISYGTLELS